MELKFDRNRRRVKTCPCCGHENKGGYVPYIGTDSGYCHYCGSSCFNDKNGTLVDLDKVNFTKPKKPDLLPEYFIEKSFTNHENIDLVKFLLGQFGTEATERMIEKYYLCGSTKRPGDIIFWQIDRDKKIRSGKIMNYYAETGKRFKSKDYVYGKSPDWVHSYDKNYVYKPCFFGEHLISIKKPIAIVESEKAALIMSECNPAFEWIGAGGSNGLTYEKCKVLKGLDVTLFPDQGKYHEWKNKAEEIGLKCEISIEAEEWFEKGLIGKGEAIYDYYLNIMKTLDSTPVKIDSEWNDFVDENPELGLTKN